MSKFNTLYENAINEVNDDDIPKLDTNVFFVAADYKDRKGYEKQMKDALEKLKQLPGTVREYDAPSFEGTDTLGGVFVTKLTLTDEQIEVLDNELNS